MVSQCLLCEKEMDSFSKHPSIPKLNGEVIKCCGACAAMILIIRSKEEPEEMSLMDILQVTSMGTYLRNRMSGG